MLLLENLKLAIFSIKSNKMRAVLTMLGIIIGITSVISISALGEASKSILNKEFDSYNKDIAVIFMSYNAEREITERDFFTEEDMALVLQKFGNKIEYLSPSPRGTSEVNYNNKKANVILEGVSADFTKMQKLDIIHGRFLSETDVSARKPVVIIDKVLAEKLFGREDAIGETLRINIDGIPIYVTVVGVYQTVPSIFSGLMTSDSTTMYLPYSLFSSSLDYQGSLSFKIKEEYSESGTQIAQEIARFMEKTKGIEENFYTSQTLADQQGMINNILNTVSLAIGAIGAISLVVGGIGIMNIMLVSVTERTREIGIRKSLGARRKDILTQFLIESMIISAIGGLIGVALGLLFSSIVAVVMKIPQPVTPTAIFGTVLFSAIVGIFFGLYPANKAAKLDPIDALRYE